MSHKQTLCIQSAWTLTCGSFPNESPRLGSEQFPRPRKTHTFSKVGLLSALQSNFGMFDVVSLVGAMVYQQLISYPKNMKCGYVVQNSHLWYSSPCFCISQMQHNGMGVHVLSNQQHPEDDA